ncbi:eukaryotic translation initiation factor 3 subunit M [Selaginella moellendorffii]|uniref:eukaryotic translation initiation factor 3 subunit M n=1 Tax=Selaginella moellendorffii TaxID=88036 RepID=UPI000D1C5719|nr:eukaryotic translation initiation factor 3 subunit M [Selaginella moellendorffii]|eukprot:XP_024537089.1 eukaryotic translation initiation factor 3 subunit M [Selaginella moellendorffii]
MTTLVETGEEDPVLAVARFTADVAWAKAGADVAEAEISRICEEAENLAVENRWSELVSLLLTSSEMVLSNTPEKDSEAVFSVITNLVSKARSPDEALAMADQIASKVTPNVTDKPALRLRILFNLYNVLDNPYGRFLTFKRAVDFAVNGKVTEMVTPSFKRMDAFLKEWNIAKAEKRKLFLAITNILKDGKSSAKDSFSFLLKYLATFSGEDNQTLGEAKEEAVRAIIEFVKAPDMFQCDLLDMAAVCQLEKDSKYAPVYRLLEIFLTSRLDAYLEFQASNPNLFKNYGLVHEECITKMRLMSLAGLASKASREIPYVTIKDALKVGDDEVEYWIVKGIATKMLDAKMDQMHQHVVISRCTERVFGPTQWKELRAKLAVWKENIWNVTRSVENARATNGVPVALQGQVVH